MEALLKSEFGDAISKTLTSLLSPEMKKEKEKQSRREQHDAAVSGAHETQGGYA